MKFFERLSRKYTRKNYQGQLVLSLAYRAVFRGNPDRAQQDMVLADLAARTGFYQVCPCDTPTDVLRHREGQREAFGVIFNHLSLSPDDVGALENAARQEALDIYNNQNE